MSDTAVWHEFHCDGKIWTVALHKGGRQIETGLYFRRGRVTRFQAFTLGALPSDRELRSMSEEVLCVLLQRASAQTCHTNAWLTG